MQEPLGLLVAMIADFAGIADVSLKLLMCALGAAALGVGFHLKDRWYAPYSSALGWISIGLFLYLQSSHYVEISDPVLVLMTASALPAGIALGVWEVRNWDDAPEALIWFRGCVVWAVIPYYIVYSIPWLNMALVHATAWNTEFMLEFTGLGSYQMGPMMVDLLEGGRNSGFRVGREQMGHGRASRRKWLLRSPGTLRWDFGECQFHTRMLRTAVNDSVRRCDSGTRLSGME